MTSWAVVCDVYFLEPQTQQPFEDSTEFASRVQQMIARQAQLCIVPWDGYLKYYNLGKKAGPLHRAGRWAKSVRLESAFDRETTAYFRRSHQKLPYRRHKALRIKYRVALCLRLCLCAVSPLLWYTL